MLKSLFLASVKLMEGETKKENFSSLIGKPKKASSYLFYLSKESLSQEIIDYFKENLEAHPTDIIRISPDDSEGKKEVVSIKQVREVIHFVNLSPGGGAKIAVIIGAELMNKESANAFLKTLEEPPKNSVILLFATSRTILATIKSRCKIFNFQAVVEQDEETTEQIISTLGGGFKEVSDNIDGYIKNEQTKELLGAIEAFAREKLLTDQTANSASFIKEVEQAKRDIKANANPKLTIESLVLRNRNFFGE